MLDRIEDLHRNGLSFSRWPWLDLCPTQAINGSTPRPRRDGMREQLHLNYEL